MGIVFGRIVVLRYDSEELVFTLFAFPMFSQARSQTLALDVKKPRVRALHRIRRD